LAVGPHESLSLQFNPDLFENARSFFLVSALPFSAQKMWVNLGAGFGQETVVDIANCTEANVGCVRWGWVWIVGAVCCAGFSAERRRYIDCTSSIYAAAAITLAVKQLRAKGTKVRLDAARLKQTCGYKPRELAKTMTLMQEADAAKTAAIAAAAAAATAAATAAAVEEASTTGNTLALAPPSASSGANTNANGRRSAVEQRFPVTQGTQGTHGTKRRAAGEAAAHQQAPKAKKGRKALSYSEWKQSILAGTVAI
jgi:hypothetical protein